MSLFKLLALRSALIFFFALHAPLDEAFGIDLNAEALGQPAETKATPPPTTSGAYVRVGQGETKKSTLAISELRFLGSVAATPNHRSVGTDLQKVIQNNLSLIGYFEVMDSKAFLDKTNLSLKPKPTDPNGFEFTSWKTIGADFLIRGGYLIDGEVVELEVYLYDISKQSLVFGKKYRGNSGATRAIGHTFCNDVMKELTGTLGPFLSQIAVASDRGGGQFKEIYVMDWDGENAEAITNHKSVALSPAWSHDGKKVAYTAFVTRAKSKIRNADLFVYELPTGKRWLTSYRRGMNSGATFSPFGDFMLLTLSEGGNPDIYRLSTTGEMQRRITKGPLGAMNVEPVISPDGKKIAFSSDRAGRPMIFIMNIDGTNPKRVTFAGQFNASPAWSPDGKTIVFAGWERDNFDIYTVDVNGSNLKRLTSSFKPNGKGANDEDPTFSPDGRLIMFTSNRTGNNQIYVMDREGKQELRLTFDNFNYFKPKWSPQLVK